MTVVGQLFDGEATITDPKVDLGLQTHGIVEAVFLLLGSQVVLPYSHPSNLITINTLWVGHGEKTTGKQITT